MKKLRYIGLIVGLIFLISTNTKAQYYYTSYGYAQNWHLPKYVHYSIYDQYYGYDIAHVQRYTRRGHTNFNVLLHRNGWFVELRFDQFGRIFKTVKHQWHYPLISHRCTSYCGYHHMYYKTYYPKYHHTHYWKKHHKTVYVNSHHGHKTTNNYYTNVHVGKQHNQQNYNSNANSSQKAKNTANINNNNKKRRTNTVIHRPQPSNVRTIELQRPQQNGNSSRIQRGGSKQRNAQPVTRTNGSNERIAYKNVRGSRNR